LSTGASVIVLSIDIDQSSLFVKNVIVKAFLDTLSVRTEGAIIIIFQCNLIAIFVIAFAPSLVIEPPIPVDVSDLIFLEQGKQVFRLSAVFTSSEISSSSSARWALVGTEPDLLVLSRTSTVKCTALGPCVGTRTYFKDSIIRIGLKVVTLAIFGIGITGSLGRNDVAFARRTSIGTDTAAVRIDLDAATSLVSLQLKFGTLPFISRFAESVLSESPFCLEIQTGFCDGTHVGCGGTQVVNFLIIETKGTFFSQC